MNSTYDPSLYALAKVPVRPRFPDFVIYNQDAVPQIFDLHTPPQSMFGLIAPLVFPEMFLSVFFPLFDVAKELSADIWSRYILAHCWFAVPLIVALSLGLFLLLANKIRWRTLGCWMGNTFLRLFIVLFAPQDTFLYWIEDVLGMEIDQLKWLHPAPQQPEPTPPPTTPPTTPPVTPPAPRPATPPMTPQDRRKKAFRDLEIGDLDLPPHWGPRAEVVDHITVEEAIRILRSGSPENQPIEFNDLPENVRDGLHLSSYIRRRVHQRQKPTVARLGRRTPEGSPIRTPEWLLMKPVQASKKPRLVIAPSVHRQIAQRLVSKMPPVKKITVKRRKAQEPTEELAGIKSENDAQVSSFKRGNTGDTTVQKKGTLSSAYIKPASKPSEKATSTESTEFISDTTSVAESLSQPQVQVGDNKTNEDDEAGEDYWKTYMRGSDNHQSPVTADVAKPEAKKTSQEPEAAFKSSPQPSIEGNELESEDDDSDDDQPPPTANSQKSKRKIVAQELKASSVLLPQPSVENDDREYNDAKTGDDEPLVTADNSQLENDDSSSISEMPAQAELLPSNEQEAQETETEENEAKGSVVEELATPPTPSVDPVAVEAVDESVPALTETPDHDTVAPETSLPTDNEHVDNAPAEDTEEAKASEVEAPIEESVNAEEVQKSDGSVPTAEETKPEDPKEEKPVADEPDTPLEQPTAPVEASEESVSPPAETSVSTPIQESTPTQAPTVSEPAMAGTEAAKSTDDEKVAEAATGTQESAEKEEPKTPVVPEQVNQEAQTAQPEVPQFVPQAPPATTFGQSATETPMDTAEDSGPIPPATGSNAPQPEDDTMDDADQVIAAPNTSDPIQDGMMDVDGPAASTTPNVLDDDLVMGNVPAASNLEDDEMPDIPAASDAQDPSEDRVMHDNVPAAPTEDVMMQDSLPQLALPAGWVHQPVSQAATSSLVQDADVVMSGDNDEDPDSDMCSLFGESDADMDSLFGDDEDVAMDDDQPVVTGNADTVMGEAAPTHLSNSADDQMDLGEPESVAQPVQNTSWYSSFGAGSVQSQASTFTSQLGPLAPLTPLAPPLPSVLPVPVPMFPSHSPFGAPPPPEGSSNGHSAPAQMPPSAVSEPGSGHTPSGGVPQVVPPVTAPEAVPAAVPTVQPAEQPVPGPSNAAIPAAALPSSSVPSSAEAATPQVSPPHGSNKRRLSMSEATPSDKAVKKPYLPPPPGDIPTVAPPAEPVPDVAPTPAVPEVPVPSRTETPAPTNGTRKRQLSVSDAATPLTAAKKPYEKPSADNPTVTPAMDGSAGGNVEDAPPPATPAPAYQQTSYGLYIPSAPAAQPTAQPAAATAPATPSAQAAPASASSPAPSEATGTGTATEGRPKVIHRPKAADPFIPRKAPSQAPSAPQPKESALDRLRNGNWMEPRKPGPGWRDNGNGGMTQ